MKKIGCTVIIVTIIALLFSGCSAMSEDKKLAVCGSYAVPGMFCHDLKGGSFTANVVSRDDYGRILFAYATKNCITDQVESKYIICQKTDSEYVYFYEDICYMETESDLESLKALNDWNKPLEQSRMTKRKLHVSYDLYIMTDYKLDYTEVREACSKAINIQPDQKATYIILDVNPSGQELYWLTVEKDNTQQEYYVLVDLDYDVSYTLADKSSTDQISIFKQENGWIYAQT